MLEPFLNKFMFVATVPGLLSSAIDMQIRILLLDELGVIDAVRPVDTCVVEDIPTYVEVETLTTCKIDPAGN